jgi:putative component of membrane protein insertase Oxa1/YidC/SpoIIIJ protein YidD
MHFKIAILTVVFLLSAFVLSAQVSKADKATQLKELFKPSPKGKSDYSVYLKNSSNELEATGALLYLGYKNFLSSQDMSVCVFHPSCSTFAIQSLQNDNIFEAYLKIFDRLSRCHGFSKPGQYPTYKNTGLLYDPIH